VHNILGLKKYFRLSCIHKEIPKAELLSSNEALKAFGKLWGEHASDVMMMLAVTEYEYKNGRAYTPEEIGAVQNTLARIVKFLKGCSTEWKEFERTQEKK